MIVTRTEFEQILAEAKGDRMGFVGLSELDTAKVVVYARQLLPVLAQAQRLYLESGGAIDTPCRAALALAIHNADPMFFGFDDCRCQRIPENECVADACSRSAWVDLLRTIARTPLPITGMRPWWRFWRRG